MYDAITPENNSKLTHPVTVDELEKLTVWYKDKCKGCDMPTKLANFAKYVMLYRDRDKTGNAQHSVKSPSMDGFVVDID